MWQFFSHKANWFLVSKQSNTKDEKNSFPKMKLFSNKEKKKKREREREEVCQKGRANNSLVTKKI